MCINSWMNRTIYTQFNKNFGDECEMANINDYLIWRGDIKLDENYGFNEIDNMILARFSYLLFDKIEMLRDIYGY